MVVIDYNAQTLAQHMASTLLLAADQPGEPDAGRWPTVQGQD